MGRELKPYVMWTHQDVANATKSERRDFERWIRKSKTYGKIFSMSKPIDRHWSIRAKESILAGFRGLAVKALILPWFLSSLLMGAYMFVCVVAAIIDSVDGQTSLSQFLANARGAEIFHYIDPVLLQIALFGAFASCAFLAFKGFIKGFWREYKKSVDKDDDF